MNGAITQKQKVTTNGNWIDVQEWSVVVTDPTTGCVNQDDLIVFFLILTVVTLAWRKH